MTGVARRAVVGSALSLSVVVIGACKGEERGPNGELKLSGTVHQVKSKDGNTEGCWKFQSSKGKDYELQPAQAPRDLLVDGAQASILAKALKGGGSFCQVGDILTVVKVDSVHSAS